MVLTLVCYVLHLMFIGLKELQIKNCTMTHQRLQKHTLSSVKCSGHIWRNDEEIVHNLLFWMPTNRKNKTERPPKTYIDQVIEETGL